MSEDPSIQKNDDIKACGNRFCIEAHGIASLCAMYPDDLTNVHHGMCRGDKSHDRYWCDCVCHATEHRDEDIKNA